MPVRPTSHFTWQVLRTLKRSKKPLTGLQLRLNRSRNTKDGSFLTALVDAGLLAHVTGSADAPFEATYSLTEKGQHAAEYGEYEYELNRRPPRTRTAPGAGEAEVAITDRYACDRPAGRIRSTRLNRLGNERHAPVWGSPAGGVRWR